jgi:hypothetical protein
MNEMRDDFTGDVKRILADRVGYHCSDPECGALTTGPRNHPEKAVNLGVAAHITAATPGGPRYNPALTPEERRHPDNGIWRCQNHAKLVDNDAERFPEPLLRAWKLVAEDRARSSLGKTVRGRINSEAPSPKLELLLEPEKIGGYTHDPRMPVRWFVLGLKNTGTGIAKFPSICYRRSSGLTVDNFGIDGSFGFGLPPSPSENEWVTFRGGVDNVIHAEATLKITKLLQQGARRNSAQPAPSMRVQSYPITCAWDFKAINFECEISCEGVPTVTVGQTIAADSVDWMS